MFGFFAAMNVSFARRHGDRRPVRCASMVVSDRGGARKGAANKSPPYRRRNFLEPIAINCMTMGNAVRPAPHRSSPGDRHLAAGRPARDVDRRRLRRAADRPRDDRPPVRIVDPVRPAGDRKRRRPGAALSPDPRAACPARAPDAGDRVRRLLLLPRPERPRRRHQRRAHHLHDPRVPQLQSAAGRRVHRRHPGRLPLRGRAGATPPR